MRCMTQRKNEWSIKILPKIRVIKKVLKIEQEKNVLEDDSIVQE